MDRRRRLVVIILFLLTITLGVVAIYIGYKLSQQPDLGPDATLAGVDDGTWINLCGTNPPSGDWGQHNSSSCTGCTQSSCSGNVVWIFECSPGEESQENGGTQCTANGRPFSGDFNSNFVDDCKMYQVDVWSDTVFGDLTDFVVWRGNRFGDPSCTSTPNQYSISGRVYCQDDGAGLSGAQIDVLGDGRGNQTTNSSGNYTFSNYDEGFSPNSIELKVDPPSLPGGAQGPFCNSNSLCTCSGGTFTSCGSLTSDFSGMDFFYTQCANANDITISGTVICAEDDSPVSGATVNIIETGQTRTVTTNAQGQFSYTAAIQTPNAIAVRLPDYPNSQKTAINCDGQHPWDISPATLCYQYGDLNENPLCSVGAPSYEHCAIGRPGNENVTNFNRFDFEVTGCATIITPTPTTPPPSITPTLPIFSPTPTTPPTPTLSPTPSVTPSPTVTLEPSISPSPSPTINASISPTPTGPMCGETCDPNGTSCADGDVCVETTPGAGTYICVDTFCRDNPDQCIDQCTPNLPSTALEGSQIRLIVGFMMMLVGFIIYRLGLHIKMGELFWNAGGGEMLAKVSTEFEKKLKEDFEEKVVQQDIEDND